jgi:hypothetical protein
MDYQETRRAKAGNNKLVQLQIMSTLCVQGLEGAAPGRRRLSQCRRDAGR